MSFREKMAWVMAIALLIFGAIYFVPMVPTFQTAGFLPPASAALGTMAIIALIIVATIGAIIAALTNVRDANSPLDEREAQVIAKSENVGSTILGFGIIVIVIVAHFTGGLSWIVPGLIALLTISHMVTFLTQIVMFRFS